MIDASSAVATCDGGVVDQGARAAVWLEPRRRSRAGLRFALRRSAMRLLANPAVFIAVMTTVVVASAACGHRAGLEESAAGVTVSAMSPPAGCERLGSVRGRAEATGAWRALWEGRPDRAQLETYAMNDLRNAAAGLGGDFVHRSEPTSSPSGLGGSAVAYNGVVYRCGLEAY